MLPAGIARTMRAALLAAFTAATSTAIAACGGGGGGGGGDGGPADAAPLPTRFGGDRPANLQVPADYDPSHSYPLLVILHGYGATGQIQQAYFGFANAADDRETLVIAPEGTTDSTGHQFWNADDACCDIDGTGVDDVGYLSGLIKDIGAVYNVDANRTYVIGHSNGAFMAYRMACERPDLMAAIMVLAGAASFADPTTCVPSQPVSVLHIHGTADTEVNYNGGSGLLAPYPGAVDSVTRWAGYDSCGTTLSDGAALDVDSKLDGSETTTQTADGCPAGTGIALWSIQGGTHIPVFRQPYVADQVWSWLEAHARP